MEQNVEEAKKMTAVLFIEKYSFNLPFSICKSI